MNPLLKVELRHDVDGVVARQAARHLARRLGFEHQDQIRIATAVSELARAALAGGGGEAVAEFGIENRSSEPLLVVSVTGPALGSTDADKRAAGDDATLAARRLLDAHDAAAGPDTVALARALPKGRLAAERIDELRDELAQVVARADSAYGTELHRQNLELSATLFELEKKQQELTRLNAELADTNRGVMALYAELDERANQMRRADEQKTKFFSHMSHELRTPLNSILALSRLLLAETDGRLNDEQAKQLRLIHDAAEELYEVVSDLLDLAKVEAGKIKVSVGRFSVESLFGALRGLLKPLLPAASVSLEFDAPADLPSLIGDESKVAQVLRNFLSNAVKFTESGSIKVTARSVCAGEPAGPEGETAPREAILFCVSDTGIGIDPSDQDVIFDEFTQVRHALQRRVRGTGLGLPLCRKIASLLGGRIWVESALGAGSSFYFLVPRFYRPGTGLRAGRGPRESPRDGAARREAEIDADIAAEKPALLVLADAEAHRSGVEALFEGSDFAPVSATAVEITCEYLETLRPSAAVVVTESERRADSRALQAIRTSGIPVVEVDAGALERRGERSGALDSAVATAVYRAVIGSDLGCVLLVDDDAHFAEILRKLVEPYCREAIAVEDPELALERVRAGEADALILDLMMPGLDGFTFLTLVRQDERTRRVPILVCSSKTPSGEERSLLRDLGAGFLPKDALAGSRLAEGLMEARARAPKTKGRAARASSE